MSFTKSAFAATLLLLPGLCLAELPTITVVVTGGEPPTGTIEVSLFNSADTFMKEPLLQHSGPIGEDGSYSTEFASVNEGEYAVVVVHDANDNGKLDRGFLGFGGEQYAFSNNARPWFGWPDFDKVKVSVQESTEIQMNLD